MQIVGVIFQWSGPLNINILSMIYRLLTRFLLILFHKHIKIFAFSTTSYLNTQTALMNFPPMKCVLVVNTKAVYFIACTLLHCIYFAPLCRILAYWLMLSVLNTTLNKDYSILFYSILFYSILFYSILGYLCPGNARNQGIRSYCIDLSIRDCRIFSLRKKQKQKNPQKTHTLLGRNGIFYMELRKKL